MLSGIEEMERKLEYTNIVRSQLSPHKGWLDILADQVMSSITKADAAGLELVQLPLDEIDTTYLAVQAQNCPCVTCNVMRKL